MEREPVELKDALAAVTRRLGMPAPDAVATLQGVLADIVGERLSAHVRVRSMHEGTCVVEVDATAFATQVRYLTDSFAQRANEVLGGSFVKAVNVVVKGL